MGVAPTKPDEIEQRRSLVADLYLNKWSARAIAKHMGVHHTTICDDITAIRKQWVENQRQSYEERIASELEECDYLRKAIAHRVDTGDTNAILASLQILNRRAKYLNLDSPQRVVITSEELDGLREVAERVGVIDDPQVRELLADAG
jgi:transposase